MVNCSTVLLSCGPWKWKTEGRQWLNSQESWGTDLDSRPSFWLLPVGLSGKALHVSVSHTGWFTGLFEVHGEWKCFSKVSAITRCSGAEGMMTVCVYGAEGGTRCLLPPQGGPADSCHRGVSERLDGTWPLSICVSYVCHVQLLQSEHRLNCGPNKGSHARVLLF